jgi:hypothetical protein
MPSLPQSDRLDRAAAGHRPWCGASQGQELYHRRRGCGGRAWRAHRLRRPCAVVMPVTSPCFMPSIYVDLKELTERHDKADPEDRPFYQDSGAPASKVPSPANRKQVDVRPLPETARQANEFTGQAHIDFADTASLS